MAEEAHKVTLNVYDLSRGLARQLSQSLLGKVIEGVWHTGIVVYGNEYSFGGGIQHLPVGTTPYGIPIRTVELGLSHVPKDVFEMYLEEISPRYTAESYNLLTHNCNNFSNEVAQFLVCKGIPDYILQLPNEVLNSPMGGLIMPMLQGLETTLKAGAVPQVPQFRPQPQPFGAFSKDEGPKLEKASKPEDENYYLVKREANQEPSATDKESSSVLKKGDEGNKTFTMRELLSELKSEEGDGTPHSSVSPFSRESASQPAENNPAMDLINRIQVNDEEGRSRQRVLAFAARKYASAIERNPDDHDALYNWALILQESADNVSPDSVSPSKDDLLEEACKKYDEATRLCPTLYDAYYNWAIAISDRAKMRGRTKEAEELWEQATNNYEKAVQLNWNSSQALNNWGLALQELSQIVPAREKEKVVRTAISKFRAAIRLQFDFHRAIYNLGTVLYGLAEDTLRTGGSGNGKDMPPGELYSQSAIYIAAAHSLKPSYSVYSSALRLVRSMLPLPHLKVGYLTAPPVGNSLAPHSDWKRTEFELNHERLLQVLKPEPREMGRNLSGKTETMSTNVEKKTVKVNITEIVWVTPCAGLTLPPGAGLCIDTIHGPVFLVADSWESLDGWLDAIRLVYTIYARGKSDVLAGIITG